MPYESRCYLCNLLQPTKNPDSRPGYYLLSESSASGALVSIIFIFSILLVRIGMAKLLWPGTDSIYWWHLDLHE